MTVRVAFLPDADRHPRVPPSIRALCVGGASEECLFLFARLHAAEPHVVVARAKDAPVVAHSGVTVLLTAERAQAAVRRDEETKTRRMML